MKEILIEYTSMKEEIKDLRRRIEKDRRELERLNRSVVADTVSRGKKGKRSLGTVRIQGTPGSLIRRKEKILDREIAFLQEKEVDLLDKQTQAEEYIQQIEKGELRIMFCLYFIDDLSYPKVALEMNRIFPKRRISYTDENVRKRISRFFENVQQCPDSECYSIN